MHLQVKEEKKIRKEILKLDLFTTPDKSFFGSSHHPYPERFPYSPQLSGGLRKPISKCIALSQL